MNESLDLMLQLDRYAMAVKKDSYVTVGHLPQKTAVLNEKVRWLTATATGRQRFSSDLVKLSVLSYN